MSGPKAAKEADSQENWRVTRREQEKLEAQLADLNLEARFYKASRQRLITELTELKRRVPSAAAKWLYSQFLLGLASVSSPFSLRRAARFRASAAKRNPFTKLLSDEPSTLLGTSYTNQMKLLQATKGLEAAERRRLLTETATGPFISVIVRISNDNLSQLERLIRSLTSQSYQRWELHLSGSESLGQEFLKTLETLLSTDQRLSLSSTPLPLDEADALNRAVSQAKGSFFCFVDEDCVLGSDALLLVASAIRCQPSAKILYTDEDVVAPDGSKSDPNLKPDWNRELFYGLNYLSHPVFLAAELVREAGCFRAGFAGAELYDLLLRCIEGTSDAEIIHIPKVLCSRQMDRVSKNVDSALDSGRRALEQHLERVFGRRLEVEHGDVACTYKIIWPMEHEPLVSIIIPTRDRLDLLRTAVESILQKTRYSNIELLIIDNGSCEPTTLAWLRNIQEKDRRVEVIRDDGPFNYSALNNRAVAAARGELIALVNNDIEVIEPKWLTEMASLALRREVGCVGAKLYFPDGRIQHGGVTVSEAAEANHSFLFSRFDDPGIGLRLMVRQEYPAVTAACLLVRKELFLGVGGLNETDLKVAFNDVDLCLKIRKAGYRNLWTPWARLVHHESATRGLDASPEQRLRFNSEVQYIKQAWSK